MAFPTGYTLYQNVTIDNTKVDATLTDYPCLVDLSDMLKAGDDIFDTCLTDGGDIRVTLTDGTTQLAREIVSIDTTAKTGEIHVKIPSLASGTDTVIRVWYNGTDTEPAADSTYGSENTWNSNYEVVCHMNDLTTSTVKDSTSNGRDGTKTGANTPSEIAGKIGQAQDFDLNEYVSFPAAVIGQATFSIQFWEYSNGTTNTGYFCSDSNDPANLFIRRGTAAATRYSYGIGDTSAAPADTISRQAWHKNLITHDSSGNAAFIVDGSTSLTGLTGSNFASLNNALYLGNRQDLQRDFDGLEDEVRVSSVEISSTWESTEYNNQSSPGTFYSVSDEQASGASAILTGTAITGGVTESEIVLGGDTIISTLTGETYVSGTTSEDAIVAGLNGGTSWNSEVRDNLDNTNIVLSVGDTVATITLPAAPGYSISANDTVILTIPAASLTTSTEDIVATPNVIVTNEGAVLLTNYYYQLLLAGDAA